MKNLFFMLMLFAFVASSCSTDADQADTADDTEQTNADSASDAQPADEPAGLTIEPFVSNADYPDAELTSMDYADGMFKFGVKNYELGIQTPDAGQLMCANSDKGQHIHLIVDNEPYIAKYEANFEQEVADGEHMILAFLSRSYHESIKNGKAAMAKKVIVKDGAITEGKDLLDPTLFYSRPKGTYVGKDTEKLLLDFFPVNADIGGAHKISVQVNGKKIAELTRWQPYSLSGLPMGDNKITLTLENKDGTPVDSPLNPVTRVITLKPDPAAEG